MRSSRAAKNRNGRPGTSSVSLFPFLAVLICTMGALILLLVVIARHARTQAIAAVAVDDTSQQEREQLEADRELVQWRIEQLRTAHDAAAKQIADSRLRLGQIEDHARQLASRLAELEAAWADLKSAGSNNADRADQLQKELAEKRRQLAVAEQDLAAARNEAAERQGSYAVVPYKGTHGTRRQPIYIECRKDSIVLQPEGVVMTSDDFNGPLGPGNPLDVALRARREYLLNRGRLDPDAAGEPYPLLLVRPRGIMAYYVAREAMKSWDSDFGYELVGDDWKLAFPPADPQMAQEIAEAVQVARVRQMRLAAAVPRYATAEARPKYRAAPYMGGAVLDGGGGYGSGGDGYKSGGGRYGGSSQRPGGSGSGHGDGDFRGGSSGGDAGSRYGSQGEATNTGAAAAQGSIAGGPPREGTGEKDAAGAVRRPGEWMPQVEKSSQSGGPAGSSCNVSVEPMAEKRGRDWALPDASRGSVPITRPIRVDCHVDRLVIVPERGVAAEKEIPLGTSTEDAMESFVSGIWSLMDTWGIAGRGMYWKPALNVRVDPAAEMRFAELQAMLDGSGLDVNRKEGP